MTLQERIDALLPGIIDIRHDLHAHPELGYDEHRTSSVVQRELEAAGVQFCHGLAGGTGVLGFIPATGEARATIALRADMDALPIEENTGRAYASTKKGVMHACGHDGHTANLIGVAQVLSKLPERPNNVLLVFQPAEEGGAGGLKMVEAGVLAGKVLGPKASRIFGLHGFPYLNVGHVTTRNGPLLASAAEFSMTIRGKGAHAAQPHRSIDPIVVGSQVVTAIQTIASRSVDPLDSIVVTIGMFQAGVAHNVIPDTAFLKGTMRTLNEKTELVGRTRLEEIVQHTCRGYGAEASFKWGANPYPVTFNDFDTTEHFRRVARRTLGDDNVHEERHPTMGGEDFSFYGKAVPASFFFLGLLPEGQETYPNLHAPEFDFNDDALPVGMRVMSELALS